MPAHPIITARPAVVHDSLLWHCAARATSLVPPAIVAPIALVAWCIDSKAAKLCPGFFSKVKFQQFALRVFALTVGLFGLGEVHP